jgi:hypothetical protein
MTSFPATAVVALLIGLTPAGCKPTPAAKPEQATTRQAPCPDTSISPTTPVVVRDSVQPSRNRLIEAIESELFKIKPDLKTAMLLSLLPVGQSDSKWYMVLAVGRGPMKAGNRSTTWERCLLYSGWTRP